MCSYIASSCSTRAVPLPHHGRVHHARVPTQGVNISQIEAKADELLKKMDVNNDSQIDVTEFTFMVGVCGNRGLGHRGRQDVLVRLHWRREQGCGNAGKQDCSASEGGAATGGARMGGMALWHAWWGPCGPVGGQCKGGGR